MFKIFIVIVVLIFENNMASQYNCIQTSKDDKQNEGNSAFKNETNPLT